MIVASTWNCDGTFRIAIYLVFTTSVNCVIAVCPADITVTVGIVVPIIVVAPAVNVKVPEGFVSDAAYFSETPLGNPITETSAVSLVDPI